MDCLNIASWRKYNIQVRFVPQEKNFLWHPIPALLTQFDIKIPHYSGQDRPHLSHRKMLSRDQPISSHEATGRKYVLFPGNSAAPLRMVVGLLVCHRRNVRHLAISQGYISHDRENFRWSGTRSIDGFRQRSGNLL